MRQLEDENFSLKAKLATATPAAAPAPVAPKVNTAELNQLRGAARKESERATALQSKLDESTAQLQQLQQQLVQANNTLRSQQGAALTLDGQLKAYSQKHQLCESSNKQMVTLANELIGRYQQQNFWQALRNHEPVTGLYRVKLENIIQDYQLKIADATVQPLSVTPMAIDSAP
jgi:chromosome segregation ATPase